MNKKVGRIIRIGLLAVFLGMFLLGTNAESMQLLFQKATNICLECIGIGG